MTQNLNLNYVFSAPAYMRLVPTRFAKQNPDIHAEMTRVIKLGIERVRSMCQRIVDDPTMKISILFNAYTEECYGEWFIDNQRFSFDDIYADSGGLQVVTRGLQLTPELKKRIYETQKKADYGFCFDEIPLGMKEGSDEFGAHRSQTASKLFYPQGLQACAEHTARNIVEQTEAFKDSNTQAFYILQGNQMEEMVRWFEAGVKIMPSENWGLIRGLAPADTCMGNGPLESIEMLVACHKIKEQFGEDRAKNHIHLLGVGSPQRLLPGVFFKQSGFLCPSMELSFDSSSSSMSYVMGNFIDSDGTRPNKKHDRVMRMFANFYDDMGDLLEQLSPALDRARYLKYTEENYMSVAESIKGAPADIVVAIRASIPLLCIWQNVGFFRSLKMYMECDETRNQGIGFLNEVKNLDDYAAWYRDFERFIKSARIDRKKETSLDSLFA